MRLVMSASPRKKPAAKKEGLAVKKGQPKERKEDLGFAVKKEKKEEAGKKEKKEEGTPVRRARGPPCSTTDTKSEKRRGLSKNYYTH